MFADLSRRRMLAAIGIASVPATATVALATAPAVIGEHPELLALGKRLDQLEADLVIGEQENASAIAHYNATKPIIPADLICPELVDRRRNPERNLAERLYDGVSGKPNEYLQFYSFQLQHALAEVPKRSRSARARLLRHRLQLAEAYEAACEAAWEEFSRRSANYSHICRAIEELELKVATFEARTIAGVVVKARAMLAMMRVNHEAMKWQARKIGPGIAADIVRLTGDGA